MNMITGGNPPAIFMNSDPGIYRDLNKQGLGVPLTKLFDSIGATKNFPPSVLKNITVDGEIMKAPARFAECGERRGRQRCISTG